jgi:3-phenylpropionate/cinnamic acid dioxygenase small subunit
MAMSPVDFVLHEAMLLDARRFDDWLDLFAPDGRYWVPLLGADQQDTLTCNSIALEDRLLLSLRVERLKDPRAHSQHPPSRCQHVLQPPRVLDEPADGAARVHTAFLYMESRAQRQVTLAGTYVHILTQGQGTGWMIREKRVNLFDPAQPLPAIQLFI